MKIRLLYILLVLTMIFGPCSVLFVSAEEGDSLSADPLPPLSYVDANDAPRTQDVYEELESADRLDLSDGWYALSARQRLRVQRLASIR